MKNLDKDKENILKRLIHPTTDNINKPTGTLLFSILFSSDIKKNSFTESRINFLKRIDDDSVARQLFCCHRGFGKTTLTLYYIAREIVLRKCKFVLFVGTTEDIAIRRTEALRNILLSPKIMSFFGALKPQKLATQMITFSREAWNLSDPESGEVFCVVSPRGMNQPVNGSIAFVGDKLVRPDLIVLDDFEDRKQIHNPEYRVNVQEYLEGELFPCIDTSKQPGVDDDSSRWDLQKYNDKRPWKIVLLDTPKHQDSCFVRYMKSNLFSTFVAPAGYFNENNELIASSTISTSALRRLYKDYEERALSDVFFKEYLCEIRSLTSVFFEREDFKYFDPEESEFLNDALSVCIVDPARVSTGESGIVVAHIHPFRGIFINHAEIVKMRTDELYDYTIALCRRYNCRYLYYEETGLGDVLKISLQQALINNNAYDISLGWVQARASKGSLETSKQNRMLQILPYYKRKCVFHSTKLMNSNLEKYLLEFPYNVTKWHMLDALSYIVDIMGIHGIYLVNTNDEEYIKREKEYEESGVFFRSLQWCI